MKRYFVSYSHKTGFGHAIVEIKKDFNLTEIKKRIMKKWKVEDIIILFFKRLKRNEVMS